MIDFAGLLPKLVTVSGGNPELTETAVKLAWKRAAGGGLRLQVVPFRLYRKTLIVSVADAIWQKQLQCMRSEFISRINRLLGDEVIDSIEFRVDPVAVNEARARAQPTRQHDSPPPIPPEVISAAVSIRDRELRQRFIRAAGNCLARRDAQLQTD